MNNTFDVSHFIKKFEDIPAEDWTTGSFTCEDIFPSDHILHCAHGHCGCEHSEEETEEGAALRRIFVSAFRVSATDINDDHCSRFRQSGPRNRILAALYVLRARGW